jgi:hypothetical protein
MIFMELRERLDTLEVTLKLIWRSKLASLPCLFSIHPQWEVLQHSWFCRIRGSVSMRRLYHDHLID